MKQYWPLLGFGFIVVTVQLIAFAGVSNDLRNQDIALLRTADVGSTSSQNHLNKLKVPAKRRSPNRRKVWYASAKGSECQRVQRYRGKRSLPLTALLSTQGSGNTWLRWLIEGLTGICTGSLYKEMSMRIAAFQCEMLTITSGAFIAYKVHYYHQLPANTSKIILLVRNPFDALVSDFNRMNTQGNHTALADVDVFRTDAWHHFVVERSKEWLNETLMTLAGSRELLVVFYENLKRNLEIELYRLADFLHIRVNDFRIKCVIQNSAGVAKRPARVLPNLFTTDEVRIVSNAVDQAYAVFAKYNLRNVPTRYQLPR